LSAFAFDRPRWLVGIGAAELVSIGFRSNGPRAIFRA